MKTGFYFARIMHMKEAGKEAEYKEQLRHLTKVEMMHYVLFIVRCSREAETKLMFFANPFFLEEEEVKEKQK